MNSSKAQLATLESHPDKRRHDTSPPPLILAEVDPTTVLNGVRIDAGYLAEDIVTDGPMRENCPHCEGISLQLVLRQKNVRFEHLFCAQCTRCFDVRYLDGASALCLA